jgi:uncharacterized membrane protein
MKHTEFAVKVDAEEVVRHIQRAEANTSGEIRVCISRKRTRDPVRSAARQFEKLGMTRTRHRNGILIYIAPASRTFAIVGDRAVHDICQQPFWEATRDRMQAHFRANRYTEGIVEAVDHAGQLLAQHFPKEGENPNELPDSIATE